MSNLVEAKRAVLWAIIEDYCGLFDILREVSTQITDVSKTECHRIATQIVSELLLEDYAELYICSHINESTSPVVKVQAITIIADPASWNAPSSIDKTYYCLSATSQGELLYKG